MKTIYKVLIIISVLVVLWLLYRSYQNKKEASLAAQNALNSSNYSGSLPPGGTSQVSQVISALFPYFNSAVENDLIGSKKTTT